MERGSPTLISTSPVATVVNALYNAGHGEARTTASVAQQRGSSLHPSLPLYVWCLAKVYWHFLCRFRYFFPSHSLSLPVLSCSRLGVTQIRSHGRLYHPLPTTVHLCLFSSKEFNTFFPRRLASNCAYPRFSWRSRQLVSLANEKLDTENS